MKTSNFQNGEIKLNHSFRQRTPKLKLTLLLFLVLLFTHVASFAHCDTYDGPVIKDALKALETNNVNLVLKWVDETDEQEITSLFNKTFELKDEDMEIYEIVEKHFFETLVRLHRATEGAPYTGLKPAGSTSPIITMADRALEVQNVDDLLEKLTGHIEKVIRKKYELVEELSLVKDESLENGRAYVAAYVDYTHTLEGVHTVIENGSADHSDHN